MPFAARMRPRRLTFRKSRSAWLLLCAQTRRAASAISLSTSAKGGVDFPQWPSCAEERREPDQTSRASLIRNALKGHMTMKRGTRPKGKENGAWLRKGTERERPRSWGRRARLGAALLGLAAAVSWAPGASGALLFGNLSAAGGFVGSTLLSGSNRVVTQFTINGGAGFNLESIDLRMLFYTTTVGDVAALSLHDGSGAAPGPSATPLATFVSPASSSSLEATFNFPVTGGSFSLTGGSSYYLLVEATAGNFIWRRTDPALDPSGTDFIFNGYQFSNNGGTSYSSHTFRNAFDLNGTIPFHTHALPGVAALGALLAWKARRRKKRRPAATPPSP